MGAADVVPGVSGGTIAFVSGIYSELINTIKSINMQAFRILRHQGILAAWKYINGTFIVVLLGGILTSIFSLARVMHYLLDTYPLPLWAFFHRFNRGFGDLSSATASAIWGFRENLLCTWLRYCLRDFNGSSHGFRGKFNYDVFRRIYSPLRDDSTWYLRIIYPRATRTLPCFYWRYSKSPT